MKRIVAFFKKPRSAGYKIAIPLVILVFIVLGILFLKPGKEKLVVSPGGEQPVALAGKNCLVFVPESILKGLTPAQTGQTDKDETWVAFDALKKEILKEVEKARLEAGSGQGLSKEQLVEVFQGAAQFPETRDAADKLIQRLWITSPSLREKFKGLRGERGLLGPAGRVDESQIETVVRKLIAASQQVASEKVAPEITSQASVSAPVEFQQEITSLEERVTELETRLKRLFSEPLPQKIQHEFSGFQIKVKKVKPKE